MSNENKKVDIDVSKIIDKDVKDPLAYFTDLLHTSVHGSKVTCLFDPGNAFLLKNPEPWGDVSKDLLPAKAIRYAFSLTPIVKHSSPVSYTLKDPVPPNTSTFWHNQQGQIYWGFNLKEIDIHPDWFQLPWESVLDELAGDDVQTAHTMLRDFKDAAELVYEKVGKLIHNDVTLSLLKQIEDEIKKMIVLDERKATEKDINTSQSAMDKILDRSKKILNHLGLDASKIDGMQDALKKLEKLADLKPEIKISSEYNYLDNRFFVSHVNEYGDPYEDPLQGPYSARIDPISRLPYPFPIFGDQSPSHWGFRNKIEDVFPIYPVENWGAYDPFATESDECHKIRVVSKVEGYFEEKCIQARFVIQLIKRQTEGFTDDGTYKCDEDNNIKKMSTFVYNKFLKSYIKNTNAIDILDTQCSYITHQYVINPLLSLLADEYSEIDDDKPSLFQLSTDCVSVIASTTTWGDIAFSWGEDASWNNTRAEALSFVNPSSPFLSPLSFGRWAYSEPYAYPPTFVINATYSNNLRYTVDAGDVYDAGWHYDDEPIVSLKIRLHGNGPARLAGTWIEENFDFKIEVYRNSSWETIGTFNSDSPTEILGPYYEVEIFSDFTDYLNPLGDVEYRLVFLSDLTADAPVWTYSYDEYSQGFGDIPTLEFLVCYDSSSSSSSSSSSGISSSSSSSFLVCYFETVYFYSCYDGTLTLIAEGWHCDLPGAGVSTWQITYDAAANGCEYYINIETENGCEHESDCIALDAPILPPIIFDCPCPSSSSSSSGSSSSSVDCTRLTWVHELLVYFEIANGYRLLLFRGVRPLTPQAMPITDDEPDLSTGIGNHGLEEGFVKFNNIIDDNYDLGNIYDFWPGYEAIYYLKNAQYSYDFFDGSGKGEQKVYTVGKNGWIKASPAIQQPEGLSKEELDLSLRETNRDYTGLFNYSDSNYAYIRANEPSNYKPEDHVSEMHDKYTNEVDDNRPFTLFTPPIVAHSTVTNHFCDHEVVIDMPIKPTILGRAKDGVIVSLNGIIPLSVVAITSSPTGLKKQEIMDTCVRKKSVSLSQKNLYKYQYYNIEACYFSADFPSLLGTSKKVSKFLYHDFEFQRDAAIAILLNPTKIPSNEDPSYCKRDNSDTHVYNEFRGPNDLSTDQCVLSNYSGDTLYFTGIIATDRKLRQIVQIHSQTSNDKIKLYSYYDAEDELASWDKYNCLLPEAKVEAFNFTLKPLRHHAKTYSVWRISEILSNAEMVHRKWLKLTPRDEEPRIIKPPDDSGYTTPMPGPDGGEYHEPYFWAADSRGIVLIYLRFDGKFESRVMLNEQAIRDQEWFKAYLFATGLTGQKLDKLLNDYGGAAIKDGDVSPFVNNATSGMLFDVSDAINHRAYDHFKLPYFRPFALALNFCSKRDMSDDKTGIGMPSLDIVFANIKGSEDFNDLSYSVFEPSGCAAAIDKEAIAKAESEAEEAETVYKEAFKEYKDALDDPLVSPLTLAALAGDVESKKSNVQDAKIRANQLKSFGAINFSSYRAYPSGAFRWMKAKKFPDANVKEWTEQLKKNDDFKALFGVSANENWRQSNITIDPTKAIQSAFYTDVVSSKNGPSGYGPWLPAGFYIIKYQGGAINWGGKSGVSIHNPDFSCSGIFSNFNYAPLVTNVIRYAPGDRVLYATVDDCKKENKDKCKMIYHLGGPIGLSIYDVEGIADNSGFITYTLDLKDPSPLIINQTIEDEFSGVKFDVVSNTIAGDFTSSSRIYVETFAVERHNDYSKASYSGYNFYHPLLDCINIYTHKAVESIDIETLPSGHKGNISVTKRPQSEYNFMTSSEFYYNTIEFHDLEDQAYKSWLENGINLETAINMYNDLYDSEFQKLENDIIGDDGERAKTIEGDIINKAICNWYSCMKNSDPLLCDVLVLNDDTKKLDARIRLDHVYDEQKSWKRGRIISIENGLIVAEKIKIKDIYSVIPVYFSSGVVKTAIANGAFYYLKTLIVRYTATQPGELSLGVLGSRKRINYIGNIKFNKHEPGNTNTTAITPILSSGMVDSWFNTILNSITDKFNFDKNTTSHLIDNNKLDIIDAADDNAKQLIIDVRNSEFGKMGLFGNISKMTTLPSFAIAMNEESFDQYKLPNTYSATAYVKDGRIFVFYHDKQNNISCALSYDKGFTWYNYSGLIVLSDAETAKRPMVCYDMKTDFIYLFFIFCGTHIAVKKIDINLFKKEDVGLPHLSYDDFNASNFKEYSGDGVLLRKEPFVLIAGEASITNSKFKDGKYRYVSNANEDSSFLSFVDLSFSAYRDSRGVLRLWYLVDGLMGIKSSYNGGFCWIDTAKDITFHKLFANADNEILPLSQKIINFIDKFTFTDCYMLSEFKETEFCDIRDSDRGITVAAGATPQESKTLPCDSDIREIQTIYDSFTENVYVLFTAYSSIYVRKVDNTFLNFVEGYNNKSNEDNEIDISIAKYIYENILNLKIESPNVPVIIDGTGSADVFYNVPPSYHYAPQTAIIDTVQPDGYMGRTGLVNIYYLAYESSSLLERPAIVMRTAVLTQPENAPIKPSEEE